MGTPILPLTLLSVAFQFGFGFQVIPSEETKFTQLLVHPVLNSASPCDPKPFRPFNVTISAPPRVVDPSCNCGVDNYKEEDRANNGKNAGTKQATILDHSDRNQTNTFEFESQTAIEFVVPGNKTAPNQFPFIAALIYRRPDGSGTHFCGGTLISSKLILTATHCLQGKSVEKTEVWLNERDLLLSTETEHPTLKLRVARFIPHPEFNPLMMFNDIALIELAEEVDVTKLHLRPICLPTSESYEPSEDEVTTGITAGWGQTVFQGPKSDQLRHVKVPLIDNKMCNEDSEEFFHGRITTHMICAGDLHKGGPDACPGDSGGPLFIKLNGQFRLIGIVSWGDRCSLPRRPGVYTRVSRYLRWIHKVESGMETTRCDDKPPFFKTPLTN